MTSAAAARPELRDADFCHLETVGRQTGRRRVVELWFGMEASTIYVLAGGGHQAGWVRNLANQPRVRVRIAGHTFAGAARVVDPSDEEARARRLIAAKYQGWRPGRPLGRWASSALPVAVDLELER